MSTFVYLSRRLVGKPCTGSVPMARNAFGAHPAPLHFVPPTVRHGVVYGTAYRRVMLVDVRGQFVHRFLVGHCGGVAPPIGAVYALELVGECVWIHRLRG